MNRLALPLTGLFLLIVGALVAAQSLEIFTRCTDQNERFNLCF
jgi:hypothetical protein